MQQLVESPWFSLVLAIMWVGISASLSAMGGWSSLATQFRATEPTPGERFRFASGSLRGRLLPVSYGGCLFIAVNEAGLGLTIFFPFRLFSPPLFIPWSEVASVEQKRVFLVTSTVVHLRNHGSTISIRGGAGKRIQEQYAHRSGRTGP